MDKTDITIKILRDLQAKNDPEEVHKFFLNSLEWRSSYRDFYNSYPWSWTWYKDKLLIKPVNAETIDVIIYIPHDNYQGAIAYIIRDRTEIKKIKSEILLNSELKLIKSERNESIELKIYYHDEICLKAAEEESRLAVIIMSKNDYESGYDLN